MRLWRKRRVPLSERLFRRFMYKYYARYLLVDLQLIAKQDTLDYIRSHMRGAMLFNDRWDLLSFALSRAPEQGLLLEFGVEDGRSINYLAGRTERTIHGFNSFLGLPEDWRGTFETKGSFSREGHLPKVRPNVRLHAGWFDRTLPELLRANGEPASFIHIDCDIYSSTRTVFDELGKRIGPGTVIVFDEYFNYPAWREHEFKAFQEFVAATGLRYEYVGFAIKNGHVMVRIL